jgi:hypothetical protein
MRDVSLASPASQPRRTRGSKLVLALAVLAVVAAPSVALAQPKPGAKPAPAKAAAGAPGATKVDVKPAVAKLKSGDYAQIK